MAERFARFRAEAWLRAARVLESEVRERALLGVPLTEEWRHIARVVIPTLKRHSETIKRRSET